MPSPEEQREKTAARALQSHAASLLMGMKLEAKTECFKHSPSHCMITSLNDSLLMVVASYLDPPDVYSLAQTSKQFQTLNRVVHSCQEVIHYGQ